MADQWVKIRVNLPEQREVRMMARILDRTIPHVVGLCVAFWAWADSNTADGVIAGIGPGDIDEIVRQPGYADAMRQAGWLEWDNHCVIIPNHSRHNGKCGKRRTLSAERVAAWRKRQAM